MLRSTASPSDTTLDNLVSGQLKGLISWVLVTGSLPLVYQLPPESLQQFLKLGGRPKDQRSGGIALKKKLLYEFTQFFGNRSKSYLVVEICWCRPRPNLHFLFDELLRGELKVSPHPLLLLLVGLTVEMADGFP